MEQKSTHNWTDMNTGMIVTCVVVGALLVFGVVAPAVQALIYHVEGRFIEANVVEVANRDRVTHELKQNEMIYGPANWLNEGKGIVSVPIDQAMKLYITRENASQNNE